MPRKRILPTEKISKEIMELIQNLNGVGCNQEFLGKLMQLSMRKLAQELLEKEVQDYIGRAYYKQGEIRNGYHNGYKPPTLRPQRRKFLLKVCIPKGERYAFKIWPLVLRRSHYLDLSP